MLTSDNPSQRTQTAPNRTWLWFTAAGITCAGAYFVVQPGAMRSVLYDAVGLVAVVAVGVGSRRLEPSQRRPWYLLAAGLSVTVAGDIVYTATDVVNGYVPFPSVADALYLSAYPLLASALVTLMRHRHVGNDPGGLIDAAVITTGVGVVVWVFIIGPVAADATMSLAGHVASLGYPLGDLLCVAISARLLLLGSAAAPSMRLLGGALVLWLVSDLAYAITLMTTGYDGGIMDGGWLIAYTLLGAAALHPSMARVAAPISTSERLTPRRLALLAGASLTAPILLVIQTLRGVHTDNVVIAAAAGVLFLLVIARIGGLTKQVQHHATRLAKLATTDPLTDLLNRRGWAESVPTLMQDRPCGVIAIIDLDNFKAYNDEFGHDAGDRLLAQAANQWRAMTRDGDVLARWGGEEFVLALPGCTEDIASPIIERIRQATPTGTTCSAGYAAWSPLDSADEILRRADAALYAAKSTGRDRLVAASALTPS